MSKLLALICAGAVTASGLIVFPTSLQAADSMAARDKAAIEALEARVAAAFNAKDVNAIMRVYEPGPNLFVFDVGPPRQHVGSADYRADWEDTFKSMSGPVHFSISNLSVTVAGSMAYGHSIQTVRSTRTNGSTSDLVVRVSDVYRKIHGKWLIVQEHVSVPVDLDTGKGDLLSKP